MRSQLLLALALTLLTAAGCAKSPAEKLVDDSISHMQAAETMMREANGSIHKLIGEAGEYRLKHGSELARLRRAGEAAFAKLDKVERARISTDAKRRGDVLIERLNVLSKGFGDAKLAMAAVRPMMIAATPRPAPKHLRGLLPKAPDLPMPGGPTPTARQHVH